MTNKPAVLGQYVGLKDSSIDVATWTVRDIRVDTGCPNDSVSANKNGHTILADVELVTGPDYEPSQFPNLLSPFKGNAWSIVGPDGVTETAITTPHSYGCASVDYPDAMNSASRYQFTLAFDSRNPTGTLVSELRAGTSRIGWTWAY
ncbi:hypothetical protein [Rhodococcus sp. HNM0569]|uniref:hypothetical protein n=1 Tax=Rhodococcus sp. HNM0569 TaxID=2716340 RepID=UPI00146C1AB5|nr:hypothetical protein [Rhodococcus sp. HNM0569]NLU81629.1 hypothetical protein [Rhodococcus sp. HNM0569]